MCCILVSRSASDTKRDYENRIEQLDRWYEDNTEAIAFGLFYRENFPKQYRAGKPVAGNMTSPTTTPSATPTPSPT